MTDEQLLTQFAKTREHEPFRQLVLRHQHLVASVCSRRLNSPADRDDAFQETFIKLARHAHRITRLHQSVGPWLYQTANTTAIDILRRRQTRDRHEHEGGQAMQERTQAPDTKPTLREQALLDDVIQSLTDDDQHVIVGYFFEQRTQRQLAEQLGVNQSTIKRRIDNALQTMRSRLARQGVAITLGTLSTTLTTARAWAQTPATELVTTVITQASQTTPLPATLSGAIKMTIASHKLTSAAAAVVLTTSIGVGITQLNAAEQHAQTAQQVAIDQGKENPGKQSLIINPTARDKAGSVQVTANGPEGYTKLINKNLPEIIAVAHDLPSQHLVVLKADLPDGGYDVILKNPDWKHILRQAIREEFNVIIEQDRQPIETYTLSLPDHGAHNLEPADEEDMVPDVIMDQDRGIMFRNATLSLITTNFEHWLGAHVQDKTGLEGHYNLDLPWKGETNNEEWCRLVTKHSGFNVTHGEVEQDVVVVVTEKPKPEQTELKTKRTE